MSLFDYDLYKKYYKDFYFLNLENINISNQNFIDSCIKSEKDFTKITIDLPGVKKENIFIELKDQSLNVKSERIKNDKNYNYENTFYIENPNKVSATYLDGVLEIIVTKKEKSPGIKVEVL